eukprot:CFRG1057T1
MVHVCRLSQENVFFLLCDIQEKLMPAINKGQTVVRVASRMISASKILGIPLVATEQYPKGLGYTVPELKEMDIQCIEKTKFSMCIPEVENIISKQADRKNLVLFGAETHVCVYQSCMDFLEKGFNVHVLADAVSSRSPSDREIALHRMRQAGAYIVSSEAVLFELCREKEHPNFKDISKLVRTQIEPYL